LAVRDEIVSLVQRGLQKSGTAPVIAVSNTLPSEPAVTGNTPSIEPQEDAHTDPRTGVEVLDPIQRDGKLFYSLRDLRNGNTVKNVTTSSARRLWHYAISKYAEVSPAIEKANITWQGNYGLLHKYSHGNNVHFDLIQKTDSGYRYFFGVTPDGIHGPWKAFFSEEEGNS